MRRILLLAMLAAQVVVALSVAGWVGSAFFAAEGGHSGNADTIEFEGSTPTILGGSSCG